MLIQSNSFSLQEKLHILSDAAKYDVACTSSGVSRRGKKGSLGNACPDGICHSFAADGRCVSLLKILLSNDCIYDCKYCCNRVSNQIQRTTFTPEEICTLVIEFYRRNYIEGLFLSSGVVKNPAYTMEQMYEVLHLLRYKYHFNGYIHVKTIPNAPEWILEQIGYLADRMSINLELPTADGLKQLAPNKTRSSILLPMRQIQDGIVQHRLAIGKSASMERSRANKYLDHTIFDDSASASILGNAAPQLDEAKRKEDKTTKGHKTEWNEIKRTEIERTEIERTEIERTEIERTSSLLTNPTQPFAPAGQSTQMIIGATGESDYQLLRTTQALYQQFDLKRVFFSAYIPLNEDDLLPDITTTPPLLREHRLYQADWLLRYYGFQANELLSEDKPNFNLYLDPKCDWALRHLELFPIEIQTASYEMLLKVPGIGNKSAFRIVKARRSGTLSFEALKKIGVVLKRAQYFITCNGKMRYHIQMEENFLTRQLLSEHAPQAWDIEHPQTYEQLSLFDTSFGLQPNF